MSTLPDHIARCLDFCDAYPANEMPRSLRERLMTRLTSDPKGVIRLDSGGQTVIVAVLIDVVSNHSKSAVLELMGARPHLDLSSFMRSALNTAESLMKSRAHDWLEVPVRPEWPQWRQLIEESDYTRAYSTYDMKTPPNHDPIHIGVSKKWTRSNTSNHPLEDYYKLIQAAMYDTPGVYLSPLKVFKENMKTKTDDLLLYEGHLAAFVSISCEGEIGYINMLGRHPDFRGQGLGELLLSIGMQRLSQGGAHRFMLDVSTSNEAALSLYLRFGFEVTSRVDTYQKPF